MENNLGNKEIMAKNITRYMQEKGINRADFCRDLGFNYNTVSDWIHARKYPRIDKIEAMAHYFGITKADLVEPTPPTAQPPSAPYRAPLTQRDERDIQKRLQAIRDDLDADSGLAMLEGSEIDENDKRLLMIAVENSLKTAKELAKKYTPKKYRKDATPPPTDTATLIGRKVLGASPEAQAAVSDIIKDDEGKDK